MVKTTSKLVLSFDAETQCFKPTAHNLSAEQAANLSHQLTEERKESRVIDQPSRHRTAELARCLLCKKAAEEATSKHREVGGPEQPVQAPADALAEESESE